MMQIWMLLLGLCLSSVAVAAEKPFIKLEVSTHQRCLSVLREGLQGSEFWPACMQLKG